MRNSFSMENSQVGSCISYNYDVGYESLPLKNTVRDVKGKPVPGIAYCTHLSTVRRGGLTGCPTGLHPASAKLHHRLTYHVKYTTRLPLPDPACPTGAGVLPGIAAQIVFGFQRATITRSLWASSSHQGHGAYTSIRPSGY